MTRFRLTLLAALGVTAVGCAGSGGGGNVASDDFVDTAEVAPPAEPTEPPDFVSSAEDARRGVVDVQVSVGAPPTPVDEPERTGEPILVDALVGDIHGQPIYVNQFFDGTATLAGVGGRLEAEARKRPPGPWLQFAQQTIREQLILIRENTIMVAEGRAQLPPQVQQGLFGYLQQVRDDKKSQNRGSASLAEETAQNTTGQSLQQVAESQLEEALIQIAKQKIEAEIHVTKHDERVEWDRNWTYYNPAPIAEFVRIYLDPDDTEAIGEVTSRLEAGEPFQEIAKLEQNAALDDGQWTVEITHTREEPYSPDRFSQMTFSKVEPYNTAVQGLSPGEWIGPVENERGTRLAWFYLVEIKNSPQTFYESQQFIRRELERRQRAEKTYKYMLKLLQRSSYTDFEEMVMRLLQIAAERYYPEAAELLRA